MTNNNNNNRTVVTGFSSCGKTYLMNYILLQKLELIFIIKKSLYQYPNIKVQTSDKIQLLNEYENSTVVSDDMLLSKQESNIDLLFLRGRQNSCDFYYFSQSFFHLPKNTFRNNSSKIILFKETLRDIILMFHDIAGLDMNLDERKELWRKAWEKNYDSLKIDRLAKEGEGGYTIRRCEKKLT